ncbi:MAG: hypothetical protein V2A74_03165 [bacterium]
MLWRRHARRRASTFILVLAALSIMVLLAATLSYTSRLEMISSANFADETQARMAAVSGVATAAQLFGADLNVTASAQYWATGRAPATATNAPQSPVSLLSTSARPNQSSLPNPATQSTIPGVIEEHLNRLKIIDESSKVNLNLAGTWPPYAYTAGDPAVGPEGYDLVKFLTVVAKSAGADAASASQLARAIVERRYGPDGAPGSVKEENAPSQSSAQPTDAPNSYRDATPGFDLLGGPTGDDTPYFAVDELAALPGMTPELLRALESYATVFSSSEERLPFVGEEEIPPLDLNTASPREIYDLLQRIFPSRDVALIKQFALNIVDRRDPDNTPTRFSSDDPPILGVEVTPYVNEVWADSSTRTEDGDDGQFIELYNPYPVALSLQGWSLSVGGGRIPLEGTIAAQGYVIVTDDYNESTDSAPEDDEKNYGSLYDIFGVVPNGGDRKLLERPSLNIPDDSGTIVLSNQQGDLVDYVRYSNGIYQGLKRSFQKADPRLRGTEMGSPTPFAANFNYHPRLDANTEFALILQRQDKAFRSPLDLATIPSGFVDNSGKVYAWRYPELYSDEPSALNLRLLDLFRIEPPKSPEKSHEGREVATDDRESSPTKRVFRRGLININTAGYEVLMGLPGMMEPLARRIVELQALREKDYLAGESVGPAAFSRRSDLIYDPDLWVSGTVGERLDAVAPFYNLIAVNSRAFSVYSSSVEAQKSQGRRPSSVTVKALMCTEQDHSGLISWKYLN